MGWLRLQWLFVSLIIGLLGTNSNPPNKKTGKNTPLKIAIIGAGCAGLASARNALEQKHQVDIFEKMETLGGIWYYTDNVGKDKYGVDIHSAMYKQLR